MTGVQQESDLNTLRLDERELSCANCCALELPVILGFYEVHGQLAYSEEPNMQTLSESHLRYVCFATI